MKEIDQIDQDNLTAAIAVGDAVCNELGICCDKRGRVIYQIYKKFEELKSKDSSVDRSEKSETQNQDNTATATDLGETKESN